MLDNDLTINQIVSRRRETYKLSTVHHMILRRMDEYSNWSPYMVNISLVPIGSRDPPCLYVTATNWIGKIAVGGYHPCGMIGFEVDDVATRLQITTGAKKP